MCIAQKTNSSKERNVEQAKQEILGLLEDGESHLVTELKGLNLPSNVFDEALEQLIMEEDVHLDGSYIYV